MLPLLNWLFLEHSIQERTHTHLDVIWREGLSRGNPVRMESLGWALIQSDRGPYKRGCLDAETCTEGNHVKRRGEETISCNPKRKAWSRGPSPPTPRFGTFAPRMVREYFLLCEPPRLRCFVTVPLAKENRRKSHRVVWGASVCGIGVPLKRGAFAPLCRPALHKGILLPTPSCGEE